MKHKFLGIGALLLGLSGCDKPNQTNNEQYETIRGVPISVAHSNDHSYNCLATILEINSESYPILASSCEVTSLELYTEAIALLQAVTNRNGTIELTGRYLTPRYFEIKEISVLGFQYILEH